MKINDYNRKVAKIEGKKKQVNIAQINEVNRTNNKLTGGEFYRLIKTL